MRADEETATRALLRLVSWVEVDESASEAAGALGRRYLRSHPGIEVADLIVAALAQELDAELKIRLEPAQFIQILLQLVPVPAPSRSLPFRDRP
ncbi:MAG: hypothetical protein OXG35_20560 [Acidobacteria bacterium]|nr:hypothetical protein [Acidobacteriota bacterium]